MRQLENRIKQELRQISEPNKQELRQELEQKVYPRASKQEPRHISDDKWSWLGGRVREVSPKEVGFQPAAKDGQRLCCPDISGEFIPPLWGQDREKP